MKYSVKLNGTSYEVEVARIDDDFRAMTKGEVSGECISVPASAAAPAKAPPKRQTEPAPAGSGRQPERVNIVCPMPGKVLDTKAAPGQMVKAGQAIILIEAMKMENEIVAPVDGVVNSVLVKSGDSVDTDAVLVVLEPVAPR